MNGERRETLQGTMNGGRNDLEMRPCNDAVASSSAKPGRKVVLGPYTDLTTMRGASCELDAEGHCVTCADEAWEASVLRVDQENGLALVSVNDVTEEVDITLVEDVGQGDLVLVHGGVAIAKL
ncbi:MAG: hypothetical protein NVSMB27_09120 [Ktedonobacteraceae bacterium]